MTTNLVFVTNITQGCMFSVWSYQMRGQEIERKVYPRSYVYIANCEKLIFLFLQILNMLEVTE